MLINEHVSVVRGQGNVARDQRSLILRLVAAGDICRRDIKQTSHEHAEFKMKMTGEGRRTLVGWLVNRAMANLHAPAQT